ILLRLSLPSRQQVVAVDVDLEGLLAGLVSLLELLDHVRVTRRRGERREHVLMGVEIVRDRSRLDDAGPADRARHAPAALEVRVLLAAEWRRAAIRPAHHLGAV